MDCAECGIVLVGCGTVGGPTARALVSQREELRQRLGVDLALRAVVDVDFTRAKQAGVPETLFARALPEQLRRADVQVVVELIGGTTAARTVVTQALAAGKHVVTANKALLATHGAELFALARKHKVSIAFEASCAGAIPIVAALTGQLAADRIEALYGIVNGTCNHILTAMTRQGQTYADALAEAQRRGLAELNPTLDVSGQDSAHKLAILAALAFGRRIEHGQVFVEGIDQLELQDIQYGRELGYVVKLLAIARRQEDGLSLRVHPAFISLLHPLAWVSGAFNAVSVYAESSGHTMYYGRGAGGRATSAAVIGDLAAVALGQTQARFDKLRVWPDVTEPAQVLDISAVRCRYYLRMQADDRPGVFGQIAQVLGVRNISISSLLQHEPHDHGERGVPVVITTHPAREGDVRAALAEVNGLDAVKAPCVCIRMVEEHPERIE